MKSWRHCLLGFVLFCIALGVGAFIGQGRQFDTPTPVHADNERVAPRRISALTGSSPIAALPYTRASGQSLRHALRELPLVDFSTAAQLLVQRYTSSGNDWPLGDLLEVWSERDPAAALAWYESAMPQELGSHRRAGLFRGWARVDCEAALNYAENSATGSWLKSFQHTTWMSLAEANPRQAMELLQELGFDSASSRSKSVFNRVASVDPLLAFELIGSATPIFVDKSARAEPLERIFKNASDPVLLEELASQVGSEVSPSVRASSVIGQMEIAAMDQERFLNAYLDENATPAQRKALVIAASKYSPELLLEALLSADPATLPKDEHPLQSVLTRNRIGGEQRTLLLAEVLQQPHFQHDGRSGLRHMARYGGDGFARASELAKGLDGEAREKALLTVAHSVASCEPREGLELLAAIEDDDIRGRSIRTAARDWAREDPMAASNWLHELPADVHYRNSAIAAVAVTEMKRGKVDETATIWLSRVHSSLGLVDNSEVRHQTQLRILAELKVNDVDALIEANEWPPEAIPLLKEIFAP